MILTEDFRSLLSGDVIITGLQDAPTPPVLLRTDIHLSFDYYIYIHISLPGIFRTDYCNENWCCNGS